MASVFKQVIADKVTQNQAATAPTDLIRLGEAQTLLAAMMTGPWNSATAYTIGKMATDTGSIFMATAANTNEQPSLNPSSWLLVLSGGADGTSSYTYVAWAADTSGTNFSLTPSATLPYMALLVSSTVIASPQASDFTGLWTYVQGPQGIQGTAGDNGTDGANAYVYIAYASDNAGTNFSSTPSDSLNYIGIINTTSLIAAPQASDFAGLWKQYGGSIMTVASPLTLNDGQIGINASSTNNANYVVQRDGSGNFSGGTITATSLVVGSATLTFSAGALSVNQPISATGLTVTGFSGVLKAAAGAVAGGASTSDLSEGTNLYFTNARATAAVLTGLSSQNIILATDSVLSALGKIDTAINTLNSEANATGQFTVGVTVTEPAATSGSPNALVVTGGAHTTLALSTEASDVVLNLARVVQFSTGPLGLQRAVRIEAPSYAFVATSTLTAAATLAISGPPIASSNATITNAYGLKITQGILNAQNTNGYGLFVDAPIQAANNYCAVFNSGFVGIGTAAPTSALDVNDWRIRIEQTHTPANSSETGQAGELFADTNYLYYRTATNVVKRIAWSTF